MLEVGKLNARMQARCWKIFVNAWQPQVVAGTTMPAPINKEVVIVTVRIWKRCANVLKKVLGAAKLNARMQARCWKGFVNAWKLPNVVKAMRGKKGKTIRVVHSQKAPNREDHPAHAPRNAHPVLTGAKRSKSA